MKVSDRIFEVCKPIWDKCYDHPFVQGLADGTLDRDKFRYFILQDHLYIMQYAKLFAIGMEKCDKEADIREFYGIIKNAIEGEDQLHKSYFKKIGITQEMVDEAIPSIANVSYTHYMLTEGAKGGPAEVIAAGLACAWLYTYVGKRLGQIPGINDHEFFGDWTALYSDPEAVLGLNRYLDMVNRYSEGYTEAQIQKLIRIVETCSQYEYNFWDAAWTLNTRLI